MAQARPAGPAAVLADAGLARHRGSRRRRGRDHRRIGGAAWLRPRQRDRGPGQHHRDLAVHRLTGTLSERRAQQLVAVSFWLLAPYIAVEAILGLISGDRPETSWAGIALTAGTFLLEPPLGIAKRRLGQRLGSAATAGEGTQNLLCAYLAGAVFTGLVANTAFGWWWLDGAVALLIAAWAVREGWLTWHGAACPCSCAEPFRT